MKYLSILIVAWALMSGCASGNVSDIISDKAKGKGDSRVFQVSSEKAWKISDNILRDWMGSNPIEEHREAGYLLATAGADSSKGSIVVWIEPIDQRSCRVTAISRKAGSFQVLEPLSSYDFYVRFEQAVAIIKSGGLLPKTVPPWPDPSK